MFYLRNLFSPTKSWKNSRFLLKAFPSTFRCRLHLQRKYSVELLCLVWSWDQLKCKEFLNSLWISAYSRAVYWEDHLFFAALQCHLYKILDDSPRVVGRHTYIHTHIISGLLNFRLIYTRKSHDSPHKMKLGLNLFFY